jgi:hypothetical protein
MCALSCSTEAIQCPRKAYSKVQTVECWVLVIIYINNAPIKTSGRMDDSLCSLSHPITHFSFLPSYLDARPWLPPWPAAAPSPTSACALPHLSVLLLHPGVLTHREHPMLVDPWPSPSPHLGEIHGARVRSMEVER